MSRWFHVVMDFGVRCGLLRTVFSRLYGSYFTHWTVDRMDDKKLVDWYLTGGGDFYGACVQGVKFRVKGRDQRTTSSWGPIGKRAGKWGTRLFFCVHVCQCVSWEEFLRGYTLKLERYRTGNMAKTRWFLMDRACMMNVKERRKERRFWGRRAIRGTLGTQPGSFDCTK